MFKKITAFALIILFFNTIGIGSAYAAPNAEKEARYAAKVKANIIKLGTGKEARIEIKLRDKTKLKGYVSQINENSFVVVQDNTNAAVEVPYPNAKQVKGNNLSGGVKIAIGVGLIIAVIAVIAIAGNSID